jgi:hypothetical protein
MESERLPIENEIAELKRKINELETKGPKDQLNIIETEKETLNNELRHELRHLQKPFIKMQSLATQGGGAGLTQDELKQLNGYMETPLETFAAEESGYPILNQILQKLSALISEDKLKLKSDKARKATQSIDVLQRDSLAGIHARSVDVLARRTQLLASSRMDEIKREISLYQDHVKLLNARKTSVETHEAVKERAEMDVQEKIRNYKHTIERNVYSFLGKKIEIL